MFFADSSPTPGHTCASQTRLCFRLEGRCWKTTTHHPAVREDLSGDVLSTGIDVSTVWKGEYFPVLTLHSSWPLPPRSEGCASLLSSPSNLCCWSLYLWLGEFTVDSRAVLSLLGCGFGQGPQAVRGRGGSPNLIPRRRLEPRGHEVGFLGDRAHSRPRSPHPQPPPPHLLPHLPRPHLWTKDELWCACYYRCN